jgi:hypothetical protein
MCNHGPGWVMAWIRQRLRPIKMLGWVQRHHNHPILMIPNEAAKPADEGDRLKKVSSECTVRATVTDDPQV